MKQVFLSGAISGVNPEYYHGWRNYVAEKLHDCCRIVDPTRFELDGEEETMKTDLWGVRNSDIVVVNFDYNPQSVGTAIEIAEATHWGIPVIGQISAFEKLHPWLRANCTKLFVTPAKSYATYEYLDDMIWYLKRNYLWM